MTESRAKGIAKSSGTTAAAGGAVFIFLFLATGSAFVGLGTLLPEGVSRRIVTCVFGFLFAIAFVALLISRIRSLFMGNGRFWIEIVLATANVALLLVAFAAIYASLGIEDTSGSGGPTKTRAFVDCLYYSVVTFTTLGYGDFQPFGAARVMAALQAFTGYLVLGILASSSASLIQNSAKQASEDD